MNSANESFVIISKIEKIDSHTEIKDCVYHQMDHLKEKNMIRIKPKASILIKPNICLLKGYETGATVDPFIVKCIVDWLLKNYEIKNIIIAEADATELNIDIAFNILGWEKTFKDYPSVKLLNLSKDERIEVQVNGKHFEKILMSQSYMSVDYLISVSKLKTHGMTGITCALKNQFGANPEKFKAQYHPDLDNVICDLNKARKPDLCIVDGIIAMEGDSGPVSGLPKPVGLMIAGNDAVSVDHACARIMGFNPKKIRHLQLAIKDSIGNANYRIEGCKIEDIRVRFSFNSPLKQACMLLYDNRLTRTISKTLR